MARRTKSQVAEPEVIKTHQGMKVPNVRTRRRQRVNSLMDHLANAYRESHEGRDIRYVYHSQTDPSKSNVISRQMDGYQLVKVKDLPEDIGQSMGEPEDLVRVGDVVLMSISVEQKKEIRDDIHDAALESFQQVEEDYYAAIEETQGGRKAEYRSRARGKVDVEQREFEYEVDQEGKVTIQEGE